LGLMGAASSIRRRFALASPAALVASVVIHAIVIAVCARLFRTAEIPAAASFPPFDVSTEETLPHGDVLPVGTPGATVAPRTDAVPSEVRAGPAREPSPDTRTAGRGGTREATEKALHLSDSIDGVTLVTDPTLVTPSSQLSRIDTSKERRSREDRRTTPNPMELTFLATGAGTRAARLTPAPVDPAAGVHGALPSTEGTVEGSVLEPDGFVHEAPGSPERGAELAKPMGLPRGSHRADYRRSAAVALARPAIRKGRASVATADRGRPDDTVDSSLEVAGLVQSLITASTAGGSRGQGPGGALGGTDSGNGGPSGFGAQSRPAGEGGAADSAASLGIQGYAAALTRKVYPFWEDAFPEWAAVEGRGGVAVIGVTIASDGSVHDLRIVRGSGYPEFDRKVARALERASPYGPLPKRLRDTGLVLNIAFDAMNPAVGRAGPGPGKR
jgi:TonB family protein